MATIHLQVSDRYIQQSHSRSKVVNLLSKYFSRHFFVRFVLQSTNLEFLHTRWTSSPTLSYSKGRKSFLTDKKKIHIMSFSTRLENIFLFQPTDLNQETTVPRNLTHAMHALSGRATSCHFEAVSLLQQWAKNRNMKVRIPLLCFTTFSSKI